MIFYIQKQLGLFTEMQYRTNKQSKLTFVEECPRTVDQVSENDETKGRKDDTATEINKVFKLSQTGVSGGLLNWFLNYL